MTSRTRYLSRVLSTTGRTTSSKVASLEAYSERRLQQRRLWSVMLTATASAALAALGAITSGNAHAQAPEPSTPPAITSTTMQQPPQATPDPVAQTAGPAILSPKYAAHDLARAFGSLDTNRDGKISRSEAASIKNVAKYFDVADTNRDQALSRQEFDTAMNTTRPQ